MLVYFLLLSSFLNFQLTNGYLVLVNAVWRHGDRSATRAMPFDPPNLWPAGLGQLTNQGISQEYALGRFLREEYAGLVEPEYNVDDIYVLSTAIDRALVSAEACMDGFYRPTKTEKWEGNKTAWYPVPIHSLPRHSNPLLNAGDAWCPKYNKSLNEFWNSKWFTDFETKHREFYSFLETKTGILNINFSMSCHIYDNLFCKMSNGKPMPEWATEQVMNKLHGLQNLRMGFLYGGADEKFWQDVTEIMGGEFINQVFENMKNKINGNSKRSMYAYSAHDSTLSAILVAIKSFNWIQPAYSSCIMIELHKTDSNYFVKFRYRNDTNHDPYDVKFLDCEINCPWEKFETLASTIIPNRDRDQLCGNSENYVFKYKVTLIVLFSILLISWLILGFAIRKSCKESGVKYVPVGTEDNTGMFE